MSEAAFKLELRLAAMEQIIRMLLVDKFAREGLTVGEAKETIALIIEKAASDTTPGANPAQSDMIAAEWEEAMRALLDGVVSTLEAVARRRS